MNSILLRKPALAIPAVAVPAAAVLAVAAFRYSPAVDRLAAASLHSAAILLSVRPLDGNLRLADVLIVSFVLFLAGVVSGLAGFAFSAVAACILWLLPPLQAVPLVMLLSACNQLLSIGKLRRDMALWSTAEREGALPYIVGGLAGVPVGVALLRGLPTGLFAAGFGMFLVAYSAFMLAMPDRVRTTLSGWKPALVVGALGGVIGGFSGFGASILVVYLGARDAGRSVTRGIVQPFILAMQLVSLGVLACVDPGIFNAAFWFLWAMTLPAVLLGTTTGVALYRRLNDGNFRRAVLILLILSGVSLVAKTVI